MPPFDLDCADRDWRRDCSPAQLEALDRRSRETDRRRADPSSDRARQRPSQGDASEHT